MVVGKVSRRREAKSCDEFTKSTESMRKNSNSELAQELQLNKDRPKFMIR